MLVQMLLDPSTCNPSLVHTDVETVCATHLAEQSHGLFCEHRNLIRLLLSGLVNITQYVGKGRRGGVLCYRERGSERRNTRCPQTQQCSRPLAHPVPHRKHIPPASSLHRDDVSHPVWHEPTPLDWWTTEYSTSGMGPLQDQSSRLSIDHHWSIASAMYCS
jgi:hypothetical protein